MPTNTGFAGFPTGAGFCPSTVWPLFRLETHRPFRTFLGVVNITSHLSNVGPALRWIEFSLCGMMFQGRYEGPCEEARHPRQRARLRKICGWMYRFQRNKQQELTPSLPCPSICIRICFIFPAWFKRLSRESITILEICKWQFRFASRYHEKRFGESP